MVEGNGSTPDTNPDPTQESTQVNPVRLCPFSSTGFDRITSGGLATAGGMKTAVQFSLMPCPNTLQCQLWDPESGVCTFVTQTELMKQSNMMQLQALGEGQG